MSLRVACLQIFSVLIISSSVPGFFVKSSPSYREDYTYEETTDAFFKLNRVSHSWSDAMNWCHEEGAELAFPATEQEAQILLKHFAHATHEVWLAIHDQYSEGVFVSTNGSAITELYNNWLMGQPDDNGDAGEDCVSLSKEGYYSDVACNRKLMFVCKKSNAKIVVNSECLTYDPGYKLSPETASCYKVHPEPRTWHEAFRICRAEMAGLVELNTQEEVDYLQKELTRFPISSLEGIYDFKNHVHICGSELLSPRKFLTCSGKTLEDAGFSTWSAGQPSSPGVQSCLGLFREDSKLNDLKCSDRASFICERSIV